MKKSIDSQTGIGRSGVVLLVILVVAVLAFLLKVSSTAAPTIQLRSQIKGIGRSTVIKLDVMDARHTIRSVEVAVLQNGRAFPVTVSGVGTVLQSPWWKFWSPRSESRWTVTTEVGRKEIAELLAQRWNRSNAAGGPTTNKVYAYAMVNAIIGVLQVAALENSPILREPDLEEALWQIAAALGPRTRKPR